MAFVVYRAPPDYVRVAANGTALVKDVFDPQNPGATDTTPRSVTFKLTSSAGSDGPSGSILIWRPPVVLVHGLWDTAELWTGFLAGDKNQRFDLTTASWADSLAGKIVISGTNLIDLDPFQRDKAAVALSKANTNQLGIQCNAPKVLKKTVAAIDAFRISRSGVAAAQADVVAHSMGGLMMRKVENLSGFEDSNSFGVGRIHKLITAGTPYLGSPLATAILNHPALAQALESKGRLSFGQNVNLTNSSYCSGQISTTGAIYDLQGDAQGIGDGLSPALNGLMHSSGHAVLTHVMAGKMDATNFLFYPPLDPPGTALSAWSGIFGGWDSDGIVSVTSQLAVTSRQLPAGADVTAGLFHSAALLGVKFPVSVFPNPITPLEWLAFQGLAEFSPQSGIVARVISLLQEPRAFGSFVELTPPLH
jgi:triacylglycerol esterase/lipase EstA (alpha/beta hydrolase family)